MPGQTATSRSEKAFTLIELLVVIAVVVLLASILLAGLARAVGTGRSTAAQRSIDALVLGVDQFKAEFGFLPPLVHDGVAISAGDPDFRPRLTDDENPVDGPVFSRIPPGLNRPLAQLVVWNNVDRRYFTFIRRRTGQGADAVRLPSGSTWDISGAWDDRRYSKFSLPYYLYGVGSREIDGIPGPGMSRPLDNGLFEGALLQTVPNLPAFRDRYDPVVDADRRSLGLSVGYRGEADYAEHGAVAPPASDIPDSHAAFVDPWGRAIRYYRWEPGRLENGQLVIRSTLDLNIPPVLLNPEIYAAVENADGSAAARDIDLTAGDPELRSARYAVVSAGPDGLFGTEPIELIAQRLGRAVPATDQEIVRLRKEVWEDNLVGLGN